MRTAASAISMSSSCALGSACFEDPLVPTENIVYDMFAEACGLTVTWTAVIPALGPEPLPITRLVLP